MIDLGFDRAEWRFESRGRYLEVADPRGLRQIFHPWAEAAAGDYGALTTRVRLPADWRGPVCCATTVGGRALAHGRS